MIEAPQHVVHPGATETAFSLLPALNFPRNNETLCFDYRAMTCVGQWDAIHDKSIYTQRSCPSDLRQLAKTSSAPSRPGLHLQVGRRLRDSSMPPEGTPSLDPPWPLTEKSEDSTRRQSTLPVACCRAPWNVVMLCHGRKQSVELLYAFTVCLLDHVADLLPLCGKRGRVRVFQGDY